MIRIEIWQKILILKKIWRLRKGKKKFIKFRKFANEECSLVFFFIVDKQKKKKLAEFKDGEYSPKKEVSRNWGKSRSFDAVEVRSSGICGEDGCRGTASGSTFSVSLSWSMTNSFRKTRVNDYYSVTKKVLRDPKKV
jgi:hypothetical protein